MSLITPAYHRLGTTFLTDDSPITKSLRISIIGQACANEFQPCISNAQHLFDQWMASPDPSQFNG